VSAEIILYHFALFIMTASNLELDVLFIIILFIIILFFIVLFIIILFFII